MFLALLNGPQVHFIPVGGQEGTRSARHLGDVVRMASVAGPFPDPEEAACGARAVMTARVA